MSTSFGTPRSGITWTLLRYSKKKIMTQFSSKNEVEAAAGSPLDEKKEVEYPVHGHALCLIWKDSLVQNTLKRR